MALNLKKISIKKVLLRTSYAFFGVAIVLSVSLAALLLYLNTEPGKKQVVAWVNESLSHEESRMVLSSIEGSIFSGFTLPKLTVEDHQGIWLEMNDIHIIWSPADLFSRRLNISKLNISNVHLHRLPQSSGESGELSLPIAIKVATFAISKIKLGSGLLATPATLTSKGSFELTGLDRIFIQANLGTISRNSDEIAVNIDYLGEGRDFLADIQLKAHQGGVLAKLVGIDDRRDLVANLKGHGPLNDWSGAFTVSVDESNIVDASLRRIEKSLSVEAQLDVKMLEPVIGSDLFGGPATLLFTSEPIETSGRTNLTLDIKAKTMRLNANRLVPEGDFIADEKVDFSFEIIDPEPFKKIMVPLSFSPFTASGTLNNIAGNAKVILSVDGLQAGVNEVFAGRVGGKLEAIFRANAIDFKTTGRIDDIQGTSVEAFSPLVKPGFAWALGGTYDQKLSNSVFSLSNGLIKLGGTGNYAKGTGALNADLHTTLNDISSLKPSVSGRMTVITKAHREDGEAPLQTNIAVAMEDLNLGDQRMNEILSTNPSLDVTIKLFSGGLVEITHAVFASKHLALEVSANITPERVIEKAQYHLALSDLENIKTIQDLALEGDIDATGSLFGSLASPSLTFDIGLKQLEIQNIRLHNSFAHMTAEDIFAQPSGNVTVTSDSSLGAFAGKADFAFDNNAAYKVSAIDMTLGPYHARGDITASAGEPASGAMTLVTETMSEMGSRLRGAINAEIKLANEGGFQRIMLNGDVADIEFPVGDNEIVSLKSGQLTATALLGNKAPQITLEAQLTQLSHPRLLSSDIRMAIGGDLDGLTYDMRLQGTEFMPYDLHIAGILSTDVEKAKYLSLGLDGNIDGTTVSTQEALLVSSTRNAFTVSPFIVQFGDGYINGNIAMVQNKMQVNFSIEKANLRPFSIFVPELPIFGILDGTVDFDASPDGVKGGSALKLSDIRYSSDNQLIDPNLIILTNGQLDEKGIRLAGTARIINVLDARFSGELPLLIDSGSIHISLQEDQPLAGEVEWQGDLGPLWPLFDLVNHDLTGKVDAKIMVSGTLASPELNGHLRMSDGRYESLKTGFVAADIDMNSSIINRHFALDHFIANDGGDGQITAEATVDFDDDFKYEAHGALNLSHAHLIRQPEIDVIASSNIIVVKDLKTTRISGELTVENANVGAVTQGGATIIDLEVREINGAGKQTRGQEMAGAHIGPFDLDLKFNAPGKLFIRSYGIESEWKADIAMLGTSDAPVVAGSAELIRGIFEFSGKRFTLTDGTCTFPNDGSNDPILNITAEHKLIDFTAIIHITGRASSPILTITSTPSMPQDEVLSRILFGTSTTELSALEAVQLATTLHSLSKGGGPGVVGGLRRALGINRLSIDTNKGHEYGTTITGGKYLTDNIYVEVTTAPATGESATSVEIRVTNNLSLVTRRTLDHDNNLAIRWAWNY